MNTVIINQSRRIIRSNMKPFIIFLIRRLLVIPVSFVIITMILFAGVMITPPETRVEIYIPPSNAHISEEHLQRIKENIIVKYHLNDPYPIQYVYWLKSLFENQWGYSPMLNQNVLPALLERTPATAELTLYSLLFFIPLGLIGGVVAGWKQHSHKDNIFRFFAFIATSFPPFILAILFLAVFYIKLGWFAPGRIDMSLRFDITGPDFHTYTGLLTIDSLINGRMDIFISAFRHLAMPVFTLSLYHWATLGRITRATIGSERHKEYITAAKARGLPDQRVLWRHVFWNTLAPSFTSMALSAASLITGVFVVEVIYNIHGVSDVMVKSMQMIPDSAAALGFALYCILFVMLLMFVLDILQAIFDPRIREEVFR